jgi:hypothetical protein
MYIVSLNLKLKFGNSQTKLQNSQNKIKRVPLLGPIPWLFNGS